MLHQCTRRFGDGGGGEPAAADAVPSLSPGRATCLAGVALLLMLELINPHGAIGPEGLFWMAVARFKRAL